MRDVDDDTDSVGRSAESASDATPEKERGEGGNWSRSKDEVDDSGQGYSYLAHRRWVWDMVSARASRSSGTRLVRGWWLPSKIFELFILVIIITLVTFTVLETSRKLARSDWFQVTYQYILIVSIIVLVAEYALRIWSCVEDERYAGQNLVERMRGRVRWACKLLSIIDLACILLFVIDLFLFDPFDRDAPGKGNALRAFRGTRVLLAISKMERQSKAFKRLWYVFRVRYQELLVTLCVALMLLIMSSTLMYYVENDDGVSPEFSSIGRSMWWCSQAMTTVGYGDVVPQSALGQWIGAFVSFLGVMLSALPAGILSSGLLEVMVRRRYERKRRRLPGSRDVYETRSGTAGSSEIGGGSGRWSKLGAALASAASSHNLDPFVSMHSADSFYGAGGGASAAVLSTGDSHHQISPPLRDFVAEFDPSNGEHCEIAKEILFRGRITPSFRETYAFPPAPHREAFSLINPDLPVSVHIMLCTAIAKEYLKE